MSFYKGFTSKRANSLNAVYTLLKDGHLIRGKSRIESGWGSYIFMDVILENGQPIRVILLDKNGETVHANNNFLNVRSFKTAPL